MVIRLRSLTDHFEDTELKLPEICRDGEYKQPLRYPPITTRSQILPKFIGSEDNRQNSSTSGPQLSCMPASCPPLLYNRAHSTPKTQFEDHLVKSSSLVDEFFKRYHKMTRLRDSAIQVRSKVQFEQQNLGHSRKFESASLKFLRYAQRQAVLNQGSESSYPELEKLHQISQNDTAACVALSSRVTQLETELSNLEFHLMNEEKSFIQLLSELLETVGISPQDLTATENLVPPSEASSEMPELLEKYYDRKGDANVRIERLQELDDNHQEEIESRHTLVARGEVVQPSDQEHISIYLAQREQIIAEKNAAEADATELAQQCKEAGIIIPPRPGSDVESLGDLAPREGRATIAESFLPFSTVGSTSQQQDRVLAPENFVSHPETGQLALESSSSSVQSWLKSLPEDEKTTS